MLRLVRRFLNRRLRRGILQAVGFNNGGATALTGKTTAEIRGTPFVTVTVTMSVMIFP
ncbi:class I SAM-dependent methyltransferase [Sesbania bispinosa]|nr:class I SAM-dependent methyltransferase [Sesbania bispinosa]